MVATRSHIEPDRLADVFCLRDKRYVTKDLTLKYDRKRIQVRAKGVALPCSIFDPHPQRMTHAAITENTHLSAGLAQIKEEQEKAERAAEG